MKSRLLFITICLLVLTANAQDETVLIHIRLINGRSGKPMKNQLIGLEDGSAGYRDISVRTDESGVASLKINKDAVIIAHNTREYVDCADERGGLIDNEFKVSQIVSDGVVWKIVQPNLCTETSAVARPGELTLFVRPWRWGEGTPWM